jgi:uracil-DNA glycosylase
MKTIDDAIKAVISKNNLENWFDEYPWLTGYLGNPEAAIWFIGENPSMRGVKNINKRSYNKTENLQWNSHDGDKLLREAITEAGLKQGDPSLNEGWHCYITNVIKAPEIVNQRNEKKREAEYWKKQAAIWWPILQQQINLHNPKVLVALGGQSMKILKYMNKIGLKTPIIEKIHHYSYIMMRPEAGTCRGPRHPERIQEFKQSIVDIVQKYKA